MQEESNLVTFDGLPLGWIKRIGARESSNMYPKELRIVNL
ncbi:MAG: methyltransferase RsmF C-terminal domain-like protein [Alistipes indistinctus]